MTPQWQRVKEVFEGARTLAPDEQARYLAEECQCESELRQEVESLLSAHKLACNFLENSVLEDCAESLIEALPSLAGRRIGSYQLVANLGSGGMGSVYLAVRKDNQFQKRVAIKLIKRGMDTDAIVRRFRNERQILASMDHPNIAKLLDAGVTSDGLPFFVMELIEGTPITEYCDAGRLPIPKRLQLFQTVCAAVQHAHRNLIVHRDLKPSNILVSQSGAPKLLDFGVAKLLNPEIGFSTIDPTVAELRMFTPGYASPEQVSGEPITTASDVYSLGIILHELLVGRIPDRVAAPFGSPTRAATSASDPERPSLLIRRLNFGIRSGQSDGSAQEISFVRDCSPEGLSKQLRGDLDTIVLKAVQKEPQRRYGSPEQLAEDIGRYLEGLPVTARRDTFGYHVGKFLVRHKTGVAAAALVFSVLLAGFAATAWQAHVAGLERARAERRFNDVRKLANSYLFEFHDAIQNLPGSTPARWMVVRRALEYLDGLSRESGNDSGIKRELATAYEKVGDVEGKPGSPNLGNSEGALASYGKSLAIRESLTSVAEPIFADRLALANTYINIAKMKENVGDLKAAMDNAQRAVSLCENLVSGDPANLRVQSLLAMALDTTGDLQDGLEISSHLGNAAAALRNHQQARAIYEGLLRTESADIELRKMLSICNLKIGDILAKGGESDAALIEYQNSLAELEEIGGRTNDAKLRRNIAAVYYRIGWALDAKGDTPGSLANYSRGLRISRELSAADPNNQRALLDTAYGFLDTGEAAAKLGKVRSGTESVRQALFILERCSALDPQNAEIQGALISAYRSAGHIGLQSNNATRLKYLEQALDLARRMAAKDPQDLDSRVSTIGIANEIGSLLLSRGEALLALDAYRSASRFSESIDPLGSEPNVEVAKNLAGIGRAYATLASQARSSPDKRATLCRDAQEAFRKSLPIFKQLSVGKAAIGSTPSQFADVTREISKLELGCRDFSGH